VGKDLFVIKSSLDYLCDIGHTTAKLLNLKTNKIIKIDIDEFNPTKYKNLIFINVNQKFNSFPNSWIDLSDFLNIDTNYKTLGIDRQVAIWNSKNSIIVDFGSAITIDIISKNKHIGGYILLGKDEVIRGFQRKTPHLNFKKNLQNKNNEIPITSEEAIYFGFFSPISYFINSLSNKYKISTIITGGYAKEFLPYLNKVIYKQNLIFDNMKLIAKRNNLI
jgi:type III pantothenate kinase